MATYAYKGTKNGQYLNFNYELEKTYELNEGYLKLYSIGFHFCKNLMDIDKYYSFQKKSTIIYKIKILGKIIKDGDKSVTNKIKIIREIPRSEWDKLSNGKVKFDKNNNKIYSEFSDGSWKKLQYDENNNLIYWKNSAGCWYKCQYDKKNNLIYYEDSKVYWKKYKYNKNNNCIYWENSDGVWQNSQYDKNNNLIYCENSDGS